MRDSLSQSSSLLKSRDGGGTPPAIGPVLRQNWRARFHPRRLANRAGTTRIAPLLGFVAVVAFAVGAVGIVPAATRLDPSPPLWGRTAQVVHALAAACWAGALAAGVTMLVAIARARGGTPGPYPKRAVSLLWLWLLAVAAVVGYTGMWSTTADDAYIFFRYAEHIAQGQGYVWNASDGPVEGCTSNLWLALLSLGAWLGLPLLPFAKLLGVALLMLGAWLLFRMLRDAAPERDATLPALVATLAALTFPTVWIAAWNGMETSLFAALTIAQLYSFVALANPGRPRRVWPYALVSLLTGLARPEGLLLAAVGIATLVVLRRHDRNFLQRFALSILLGLVVPGVLYMLWRTAYFGLFFPMPFYVKAGLTVPKCLEFCRDFALGNLGLLGLLGVTLALSGRAGLRRAPLWALAGSVALYLVFYGLTQAHRLGGGFDRYMTHAMVCARALSVFLFACALRTVPSCSRRIWGVAVAVLLVFGTQWQREREEAGLYLWMRDMYARIHHGDFTRAVEQALAGTDHDVLVRDAGQAYFLQREAVDLFGLTDPFIGRHGWLHGQRDAILNYIFHSRQPIVFLLPAWTPDGTVNPYVADVFRDPRFSRDYELLGAEPSPPRPTSVMRQGAERDIYYMVLALRKDAPDFEQLRDRLAALCTIRPADVIGDQ